MSEDEKGAPIIDGERMLGTYRRKHDKRRALRELSGLNGLSEQEVTDILLLHGLNKKELPRAQRKTKEEPPMEKRPVEEEVVEKLAVPGMVHCVVPKPTAAPEVVPEKISAAVVIRQALEAEGISLDEEVDRPIPWELLPILMDIRNLAQKYPLNNGLRDAARDLILAMAEEVS